MKTIVNEKCHACLWVLAFLVFRYSGIPPLFRYSTVIPVSHPCSVVFRLFRWRSIVVCSSVPLFPRSAGVPCSSVAGLIVCHIIRSSLACSAHCWSFIQCQSGNFLMQSWHKLCNVDAVKINRFSGNQPVLQSTITACSNTKNGQCNSIYPHSVISASYLMNQLHVHS